MTAPTAAMDPEETLGRWRADEATILDGFLVGGR